MAAEEKKSFQQLHNLITSIFKSCFNCMTFFNCSKILQRFSLARMSRKCCNLAKQLDWTTRISAVNIICFEFEFVDIFTIFLLDFKLAEVQMRSPSHIQSSAGNVRHWSKQSEKVSSFSGSGEVKKKAESEFDDNRRYCSPPWSVFVSCERGAQGEKTEKTRRL